jgi:hypothetical protein
LFEIDAIFDNSKEIFYTGARSHKPARQVILPIICFLHIHTFNQPSINLRLPDSSNGLGDTNIVGLKLVQSHADKDRSNVEKPVESLAEARVGP